MKTGEAKMLSVYKWRRSFLHTSPGVVSTSTGPATTRESPSSKNMEKVFLILMFPLLSLVAPASASEGWLKQKMNSEGVKSSDFFILRVRVSPARRLPWLLHRLRRQAPASPALCRRPGQPSREVHRSVQGGGVQVRRGAARD